MRGVRAWWKAPQVLLLALLASCDFSFTIEEPAIELGLTAAYSTGDVFEISYKFITDESTLRCRYTVNAGSEVVLSQDTGLLTPGVLYTETIDIPDGYGEGNYLLNLVGQVERGGSFVDMASLSQTVEIGIDLTRPLEPDVSIPLDGNGRYGETDLISLDHPEWPDPVGGPVRLIYSFDAEPSVEVPPQAGEIQIGIPSTVVVDANPHTFQVTAIDEAGNELFAPVSRSFKFLRITMIENVNIATEPKDYGYIGTYPVLRITGYTFGASDTVELVDVDGTRAALFSGPTIDIGQIQVTYNLAVDGIPGPEQGANATIDPGTGYFRVTTDTASSTTIPFAFLP